MDDKQLDRYSRQILLPEIDIAGQEKLLRSRVLIIGAGGLGSPAALYMAGSGIGHILINDHDTVDISNLHRQILHRTSAIGHSKTTSAIKTLHELNPDIKITAISQKLDRDALQILLDEVDAVVDASDNFPTRYALNSACADRRKPLISGAVIKMEGQVSVFRHDLTGYPCFECLYSRHDHEASNLNCSDLGILAPVAGIIGSIMATETIKVLLSLNGTLAGRLLLLNAKNMIFRSVKLHKDPHCPVCSINPPIQDQNLGKLCH